MKLALITDIHANREAFEACLEQAHLHGAERLALLGDFVGYGADPGWVVDQVRDLVSQGAIAIKGNHDEAVATAASQNLVDDARRAVAWTRERLDASQVAFLAGLPMSHEALGCLFVHANAYAPAEWDYVLGRQEAVRSMQATRWRHTFCGHVHTPALYHLSSTGKIADFSPTPGVAVPVPSHRQWLALPGSAGQPRDGNPAACWALFDAALHTLTFHRVPYDVEAAAAKVLAGGLPAALADRLLAGT
jgi:diadenosine tetraphosphatase ApaH/serine/threonine PP2A family protein phosphatase